MSRESKATGEKLQPQGGSCYRLSQGGCVLALLAVATVVLAGIGNRFGWWNFRISLQILRWAAAAGAAALVLSLASALLNWLRGGRKGLVFSIIGLLAGLAITGTALNWRQLARSVPPIHDISTDIDNPPQFHDILALRKEAPNPAFYGGPDIAAQQLAAYPDIKPLMLAVPTDKAFDRAVAAARAMGWEIVASNPAEGRIEATATTFWFGFKDDVVIRIAPDRQGSRVDVRSVSRVGRSDVGTNARRIRAYLQKLSGNE